MKYSKPFTISLLLSAALTIVIASCGSKTESTPEAAVEEVHHEGESTITLSQQQFNSIKVQLGSIEQKNLTGTFRASGFLKVPPQNKANVTSPLGGTVKSILVQEGDIVSIGQTLATLFPFGGVYCHLLFSYDQGPRLFCSFFFSFRSFSFRKRNKKTSRRHSFE